MIVKPVLDEKKCPQKKKVVVNSAMLTWGKQDQAFHSFQLLLDSHFQLDPVFS